MSRGELHASKCVTGLGPNRIPGHQPEFTRGWNPPLSL